MSCKGSKYFSIIRKMPELCLCVFTYICTLQYDHTHMYIIHIMYEREREIEGEQRRNDRQTNLQFWSGWGSRPEQNFEMLREKDKDTEIIVFHTFFSSRAIEGHLAKLELQTHFVCDTVFDQKS